MDMIPTETMSVKTGARLLETLTSALYADPIVVFREYVQNAIDSFRVSTQQRDFRIDIILVPGKRKIIIRDNGDGIPSDKFEEKMMSLGSSEKTENQIGFRGIGRLAGLSFCDKLCFKNRANQKNPSQSFVLEGKKYRSILTELNSGSLSLNIVMNRIKSTDKPSDVDEGDWSFEVSLDGVTDELMDCIYSSKPKRGKAGRQPEVNNELLSSDSLPTEDFVNALSMLLPVPYSKEFTRRSEIVQQYQKWFGTELSAREFKIFLNGVQLFKPFSADEQMDFRIIPLYINDLRETANDRSQESKIVGLLWMSFDYVFKAVKKKFGIAVRSKNMLVRGGAVLAEEAANSRDAITTYGQYLSAIKGVTGELLLETDCLSDNSRRDWFKVDKNSLQLRDQLCYLMNRMHNYRYKISRYMHNDRRTDGDKQQVLDAYRELVAGNSSNYKSASVEQYMESIIQQEDKQDWDDRADFRDILGYTMTQKQFYQRLMLLIYDYFSGKEITDYYALKSYILQDLNEESVNSD